MNAEEIAYLVGVIFGALVVGCLLGLLPLVLARKQGRKGIGWSALAATAVAGLLLGVFLALPVSLIFTAILLMTKPNPSPENVDTE